MPLSSPSFTSARPAAKRRAGRNPGIAGLAVLLGLLPVLASADPGGAARAGAPQGSSSAAASALPAESAVAPGERAAPSGSGAGREPPVSPLAASPPGPALPLPPLPPTELDFLQYGAAFVIEGKARAGNVCPSGATAPCILGSGGGLLVRVGHRSNEGWYFGGVYEFSKQNAANLLKLPILQQARAELRRYLVHGLRVSPYLMAGAGVMTYGSEWRVATYGGVGTVGFGIELETTREVFFGLAPSYRILRVGRWTDATGQDRPTALAHFVGLELTMEARSAFSRW